MPATGAAGPSSAPVDRGTAESDNRRVLFDRASQLSIPYLVDPNTGEEMAESGAIVDYLERTYAL